MIKNAELLCNESGCLRLKLHRGYCDMHYSRKIKSGELKKIVELHGMDGTPVYKTWISLRARCNNANDKDYARYGERGISVCDEWNNSFTAFYKDMGDKPSNKHQIDRINNDGNYEPNNCRWTTCFNNNINRSVTKLTWNIVNEIRILGCMNFMTVTELANMYGISRRHTSNIITYKNWKVKNA